jgi:hypothetical protein
MQSKGSSTHRGFGYSNPSSGCRPLKWLTQEKKYELFLFSLACKIQKSKIFKDFGQVRLVAVNEKHLVPGKLLPGSAFPFSPFFGDFL